MNQFSTLLNYKIQFFLIVSVLVVYVFFLILNGNRLSFSTLSCSLFRLLLFYFRKKVQFVLYLLWSWIFYRILHFHWTKCEREHIRIGLDFFSLRQFDQFDQTVSLTFSIQTSTQKHCSIIHGDMYTSWVVLWNSLICKGGQS